MKARFWPLATIAFGLITWAIAIGFSTLPEVRAVYASGAFGPALGLFQRAETPADLDAVFGNPAAPAIIAAMHAGNTLDLYGFIPAYELFLVAAAAMLAGGARKPLALLSIVPTLIGAGADVIETWTQLRMTADWANAEDLLPIAPLCWTKYFALALGALGASAICLLGARKRWIVGLLGFAPLGAAFADWAGLIAIPTLMTAGFGAFWIALVAVGFMETARAKDHINGLKR